MSGFKLKTAKYFGDKEISFYKKDGAVYMGFAQLAEALGYTNQRRVSDMLIKNPFLKEPEFSFKVRLLTAEGKKMTGNEMRLFTEEGIRAATAISEMANAGILREWLTWQKKSTLPYPLPEANSAPLLSGDTKGKPIRKIYTVKDVQKITGLSSGTVKKIIKSGLLKAVKVEWRICIPAPALKEFLETPFCKEILQRESLYMLNESFRAGKTAKQKRSKLHITREARKGL